MNGIPASNNLVLADYLLWRYMYYTALLCCAYMHNAMYVHVHVYTCKRQGRVIKNGEDYDCV